MALKLSKVMVTKLAVINVATLYISKVMKIQEEKSKMEVKSSTDRQDLERTIAKLREDISAIAEDRDDYSKRLDEAVSDKDKTVSEQGSVLIIEVICTVKRWYYR